MDLKTHSTIFFEGFKLWSEKQIHIKGICVLGSFARGDYHEKSDVDLSIITKNKDHTVHAITHDFDFGKIESIQIEEWGIVTFLRIRYENGLEVDYGVVTDQWVIEPLDERTKNVVMKGFRILIEKENIFQTVKTFLSGLESRQ